MKNVFTKMAILIVAFCTLSTASFSQNWTGVRSEKALTSESTLIKSSINETILRFDFEGYYSEIVATENGEAMLISGDKMSPNFNVGEPNLPSRSVSIIIPETGRVKLEVIGTDYYDMENVLVAPSKGLISRQIDPASVPYNFGSIYKTNAFFPNNVASLSDPFILRDFRGVTISFSPLTYNPVTKTLRVYRNIEVKVTSEEGESINELGTSSLSKNGGKLDSDFESIYSKMFSNFTKTRYQSIEEDGSMLVICYDDFYDSMLPFVNWKCEKGIKTEMFKLSEVGTTTNEIKTYIKEYYESNGNKYVLLVGDSGQVPSPSSDGGLSDPTYAQIVGNDLYIDVLIGRFSAQTLDHVETYVQKVLNYEKNPSTEKDWFSTGIGIASREGPGHYGEYDYQHIRKIRTKLTEYNYYAVSELYEGSQGGEDASGNPTSAMLSEKINEGASIINYIGHGDWNMWVTSGFNNSSAKALENYGMYPFIWSVACVNGQFNKDECFAEAWTRNSKNDQPIGAIGFMGSSINQPWEPPMYAQDEMNDILTETYSTNIKRSFGGLSFNGIYKMIETLGNGARATANTWNCFGDPSVIVRTSMPEEITANIPQMLPIGTNEMTINCLVDGATVCVSLDGKIIGVSKVEDGIAKIDISTIQSPCLVKVTISKYNAIPIQGDVKFEALSDAFLSLSNSKLDDSKDDGNNDGILNAGETVNIVMTISNIGGLKCDEATITVSSDDETIEILSETATINNIEAGASIEMSNIVIKGNKDLVDKKTIKLNVNIKAGESVWESEINIIPQAVNLEVVGVELKNENGRKELNPGEVGFMKVKIANNGSVNAKNTLIKLNTVENVIIIGEDSYSHENIQTGQVIEQEYKISLDKSCEYLYTPTFKLDYNGDNYEGIGEATVLFAKNDVLAINIAKNDVSTNVIKDVIVELGYVCDQTTEINSEDISKYRALFITLGIGSNSVGLTEEQGTILANFLTNGGSIYMEGGDTWSYNKPTAVHPMFGIAKVSDGANDLSVIESGINAVCETAMSFKYTGENKFIDKISAISPAFVLFENKTPNYVNGVANRTDDYSTIGVSFAFAGLEDGIEDNTKSELMQRYLTFLGVTKKDHSSVNNTDAISSISVYPNPSKGVIKIDGECNSISVYDMGGREVVSPMIANGQEINLSKLQNGIYIMRISTNDGEITKRIVINK